MSEFAAQRSISDSRIGGDTEQGQTAQAPPFRAPAPAPPPIMRSLMGLPGSGQKLDDFELLRLLGTGSFAKVFLARQVSLDRHVALKVSINRGNEARTLASLEHDHIVRVFSEVVDPQRDLRLLCMQYVPGTTLECIIATLAGLPSSQASGRAILEIVDNKASDPAALDLAALRDRELLSDLDFIEAGCWMGARLAEALAHAHRLGVLHRDVKPANILVNRYGRPLLVDFNVASASVSPDQKTCAGHADAQPLGGTLAYMSPEHLDAFNNPASATVDARSDVYSLGVVLYELFAGRRPFPCVPETGNITVLVQTMAEQRRGEPPLLPLEVGAPPALQRVIARCLAPQPEDRYQSAAELAEALASCLELRRVEREMPEARGLTRLALRHPFMVAAVLMPLPHFLGSVVNISYNKMRIQLTEAQHEAFLTISLLYNLIVYPVCLFLFFRRVVPVFRTWRQLSGLEPIDPHRCHQARQQALALPRWAIWLACVGWLPGGLIFPLALDLLAGPVSGRIYGQFVFSFTVSGLIALTYSVIAVEFVVVRVLYAGLWLDARHLRPTARSELEREEGRLAVLQFLAVLVPLAGATLMLSVGPEQGFTEGSYRNFRMLVTALLAVGMVGLGVAILASHELRRAIAVLVGASRRRRP